MEQNDDIVIQLSEPQSAVLECRQQVILQMAGQGSGKSQVIGYSSGMFVSDFPRALGFIGANTHMQLSQSTLYRVFETWKEVYGFSQYDAKANRAGAYVVDKRPPPHFERLHSLRDYDGTISFYNGALIYLGSLENYKAHDGKQFAWAHLDETKDTDKNALKQVIMGRLRQYGLWFDQTGAVQFDPFLEPAAAQAKGWTAWNPLYVHTSPSSMGVEWLNDMFKLRNFADEIKEKVTQQDRAYFHREFGNKAAIIYPTYFNAHNLPPNYISNQIENLADDDQVMLFVNGYPFAKSGGEFFPAFSRLKIVRSVAYKPGSPVYQSWDFNVVPFMTLLCIQVNFITRYLDAVNEKHDVPQIGYKAIEVMRISLYKEYCLKSPLNTTEACCDNFKEDHSPELTEVFYGGDAHGNVRIPGLGSRTNYADIADYMAEYLHNNSKWAKKYNIGVFKRRDLLNKIFAGKIPEIEIEIDHECVETIEDLEKTKLGPKGKFKEKAKDETTGEKFEKRGHPSDALEYVVCELCKSYLS